MIHTATGRGDLVTELIAVATLIADRTATVDELVERRNELILELRDEGINNAQLAQLAGLTRQRIHQLTHQTTEEVPT